MKILFFDTETTGKVNWGAHPLDVTQPHLIQLGAVLEVDGREEEALSLLVQSNKSIEEGAFEAHRNF